MRQGYIPEEQPKEQTSRSTPKQISRKRFSIVYWASAVFITGLCVPILGKNAATYIFLAAITAWIFIRACVEEDKPQAPLQTKTIPHVSQEFTNAAGHRQNSTYEFVPCKVAGVTFKNGRRSRQTILRQIKWRDEPYDKDYIDITLQLSEFDGEPAVEVWANEEQIGYVPKNQAPFFANNWERCDSVFDFEVHGGGTLEDGEKISYGASFIARFRV